jgi:transglutaminase-like putative cysteine protease
MADLSLTARSRHWLLVSTGLVLLPHAWHLPVWVILLVLGNGLLYRHALQQPPYTVPRFLVLALTLAGATGVLWQYGTLLGRNAGVTLLVIMLSLKLLEARQRRDALLVIFTSYFVVITNFLFTETPLIALYMFAISIVITATLSVVTHDSASRPAQNHLRQAGTMLLQALPVMLVLFIFFPRIIGPIWGMPQDAHAGVTGLSGSMSPGAISRLVESGATAFRARFSGPVPEPAQRYWRGPVLWKTDGRTWTTGGPDLPAPPAETLLQPRGKPVQQEITLESHNKRWLLALDLPFAISIPATRTVSSEWLAPEVIRERIRYTATSYTEYQTGDLNPLLQDAALQLPENLSERLRELAQGWRRDAGDRTIIRKALEYFHNEPFIYTLRPPPLGEDPMDEFLFESRRGFCEHYSAAFVLLMRSAGIPARVVTGYQGGEYNPVGEYLLVRQSDAHAWAEVWLPETGWERVDPTAAVAPERIEHALDLSALESGAPVRFRLIEGGPLADGWRGLRYAFDTLNNGWNQWVLSYGPARQRELLAALGIKQVNWKAMVLVLAALISAFLSGVAAWMFLRKPSQSDPVLQVWNAYCRRLGQLGMQRKPGEGPRDYSRRVVAYRPELASHVNPITDMYIRLRYDNPEKPAVLLSQLRHRVRQFARRGKRKRMRAKKPAD